MIARQRKIAQYYGDSSELTAHNAYFTTGNGSFVRNSDTFRSNINLGGGEPTNPRIPPPKVHKRS